MQYAMTTYLEEALLNHTFRNVSYTSPTTVYIALYTSNPTESGEAGTEVTGTGYERQAITFDAPTQGADLSEITNQNIEFALAESDWGVITHVAIRDDSLTGNALMYGELTTGKTIETGDVARFRAGDLTVKLG